MLRFMFVLTFIVVSSHVFAEETEQSVKSMPSIAMHGMPKYMNDFQHFEYANPNALKGGTLRLSAIGTFDNLNAHIIKGVPASGMGLVSETLMIKSDDEAFTKYGLIAESIETPEDRSWVAFNLREEARWHDRTPITAADVVWSFNTLIKDGHPFYRAYYANVKEAIAENDHRVKFTFDMVGNMELPLIMAELSVFPKHYWEGKEFGSTTLEAPLGSGPYKVKEVHPGRRIVFERVKDWWAKDLPINKGRYNFDEISFDYYRDDTVALQALLSGEYDFRQENTAKTWATAYDTETVKTGQIKKELQTHEMTSGMQGFIYNIRHEIFSDPLVREALTYGFDFEWSNEQFAYGTYKRSKSYFSNSELGSSGLPEGRELEILEQFKGQIPDKVFTTEYVPPKTNGSGKDIRSNIRNAIKLLKQAGWEVNGDGLREKDGVVMSFEILAQSPAFERWVGPMIQNFKKMGVEAKFRVVDTAQYQNRMDSFDFDMTIATFGQSLSPGNEQRDFWHSEKADINGSRNLIGIRNPVVDQLVDMIISAPDREELVYRTRALDRVLLWNHYLIPQWYLNAFRMVYWDKFGQPDISPKYGLGVVDTWWAKE